MRLMQVVADGSPGGGTTCVLQLTEDLVRAGHEVHLISQRDSYALERGAECGAVVHYGIDFFRSRFDRIASEDMLNVILQVAPEMVHLHGGRAAFFWSRIQRRARSIRSVYTVHGYHFTRKHFLLRQLAKTAERRSSRAVDETVFVSYYDQRLAKAERLLAVKSRQRVIYNGVQADELPAGPIVRESKRIAAVGRLTYQKDPHRVLDIAAMLRGQGYQIDMIGGGEMEQEIRHRVSVEKLTNVTIHGAVTRQRTLELLSRAGVFLLASRWEGLPIAPLEAMQCGVPVVISDVGGNPEVVEHGVSGFVVPQTETVGYVRCILRLAGSPGLAADIILAAKERVDQLFSRRRMAVDYLELYSQILA